MNAHISGPYCPISSYLRGGEWIPSDQTDITATFKREVALMRSQYYESAYDEVTQTDWLEIGGFK